jgi:hypothetical protein
VVAPPSNTLAALHVPAVSRWTPAGESGGEPR